MSELSTLETAWQNIPLCPLEVLVSKGRPATLRLVNSEWRDAVDRSLRSLKLKGSTTVSQLLLAVERFPRLEELKVVIGGELMSLQEPQVDAKIKVPAVDSSEAEASQMSDAKHVESNVRDLYGVISQLQNLRKLVLRPMMPLVASVNVQKLSMLTQLTSLDMTRCSVVGFKYFSCLPNLKALVLPNRVKLNSHNVEVFSELPNLTMLSLSKAVLDSNTVRRIVEFLPGLTSLDLNTTNVTDECVQYIRLLPALSQLILAFTRIGNEGMYHLRDLTRLTHLSLRCTCVGDEGISHILRLSSLKVLILAGSYVGDDGLASLTQLTLLRMLNVVKLVHASSSGVRALSEALPSVRILSLL